MKIRKKIKILRMEKNIIKNKGEKKKENKRR